MRVGGRSLVIVVATSMCLVSGATVDAKIVDIPSNYPVPVESLGRIEIQSVAVGDTLFFGVPKDINKDGCTVIPEGSTVAVRVQTLRSPGWIGSPSHLVLEVVWVRAAGGKRIFLRGTVQATGEDLEVEALGVTAAFCCLGIFMKGGRQSIARGVGTVAFTRSESVIECEGGESKR